MNNEIMDYKLKGYCCSQIIMEMGLKRLGLEDKEMIKAMRGLCFGMNRGKNCGILTAAMCLIYLAGTEETRARCGDDFFDWFEDNFGAIDCEVLLEGDPMNKVEKCPVMIEASFAELSDILEWDQ